MTNYEIVNNKIKNLIQQYNRTYDSYGLNEVSEIVREIAIQVANETTHLNLEEIEKPTTLKVRILWTIMDEDN